MKKGLDIARSGIYTDDNDIISDSLWAVNYVADNDNEEIYQEIAGTDLLAKLISFIGSKDMSIFVPALRGIGNMLTTNNHAIIERALFLGLI